MKSKTCFSVLASLSVLMVLASGCGANDEPTVARGPDGASAADPGVARAKAVIDRLSALPKSIGITDPVNGTIPVDKRIVYVPLNVPAATENIQFLEDAGDELGWQVDMVSGGLTPEDFKAALAQVLKDAPDGVFTAGIPAAIVTQELEGFRAAEIPVVMLGTGSEGVDNPPVLANLYAHAPQEESGTYNADWVIADSAGSANIVYYDFTTVETVAAVGKGFAKTIEADCPQCTIENIDVNGADIGTNLPGQIVSYLRAHPETNYVALAFSDLAIGVPGALTDAGIASDKVRIIGANPGPGNRVNIAAGNYEQAAVSFPKQENMWRVIDIFARHFTGDDIAPSVDAPYPYFMFTSDNVDAWGGKPEDEWPIVPDYREQYLALWGR